MSIELRDYQRTILTALRAEIKARRRPVLVSPCGSGKGTLITFIVKSAVERGGVVIFGVRGKSLVEDMSQRLRRLGIQHGVLMGERKREPWHQVQVASIDTLYRMDAPPIAKLCIVDEAHMSLSPTWRLALGRLPADAAIIGMTATPIGPGGKGLGRASGGLFDSIVRGPSVKSLIADGFLVRSRVLEPPPIAGARAVKLGITDNLGAQAAVFDKPKLIGDAIRHYREHAAGRKGVIFCSTQAHASHMAEQFSLAGIPWAYVDADTSLDERADIYRDLDTESGTLMGVASVGCVSIGWDHPIVSYLGIMRLTQSFGLWHQMMGRGSRTYPGKTDFLIIDHAGNTEEHKPFGYFESDIDWQLNDRIDRKGLGQRTCNRSFANCVCDDPLGKHEKDGGILHLACYGVFDRLPPRNSCPYCNCPLVPEPGDAARVVKWKDGNLTERERPEIVPVGVRVAQLMRDHIAKRAAVTDDERHQQLHRLLNEASRRGYQSGWARHQFITKFGAPPPTEWMPREWRESHQL